MTRYICPRCEKSELEFHKSSWEQYQPSDYYCPECRQYFSVSRVEVANLKMELKVYKDALEFYANEDNWDGRYIENDYDINLDSSNRLYIGGKQAREALEWRKRYEK